MSNSAYVYVSTCYAYPYAYAHAFVYAHGFCVLYAFSNHIFLAFAFVEDDVLKPGAKI